MRKQLISGAIAVLALSTLAIPVTASADGGHAHTRRVRLLDNCDPATFNAVFGPVCAPHGNARTTTLDEFLAKLNPVDFGHPKWGNKPEMLKLDVGDSIDATVRGGEVHTFTEVPMYGPGCIPELNGPLGLVGPPVTDCGAAFANTAIEPGGHLMVSGLSAGEHKFMCVIHPWMRTTVEVRMDDDD